MQGNVATRATLALAGLNDDTPSRAPDRRARIHLKVATFARCSTPTANGNGTTGIGTGSSRNGYTTTGSRRTSTPTPYQN